MPRPVAQGRSFSVPYRPDTGDPVVLDIEDEDRLNRVGTGRAVTRPPPSLVATASGSRSWTRAPMSFACQASLKSRTTPACRAVDVVGGRASPTRRRAETALLERTVNGRPGLVVQVDDTVQAVLALDVEDDRVTRIWAVRNPEKLRPWTAG